MPSPSPRSSRCIASAVLFLTCLAFTPSAHAQTDAAQLISHNLPSVLSCGQTYDASVTMKNIGTTTWYRSTGESYKLGAIDNSDPFTNDTRVWLPSGTTVAPGQSHTFEFTLTAPSQEGTYYTDWQMVHELVAWFGPIAARTVFVTCQENDSAQLVSHNLPTSLSCGQTYNASVTMLNTGNTTWTRDLPGDGYKLGAVDNDDPFHNFGRVLLPAGVTVEPGQSHTFNFTMQAPSQAGSYFTDWRMVREFVAWFGPTVARNVNVSCTEVDDSQVISMDLPTSMSCGGTYSGSVTMRNAGTSTWTRDLPGGGFKLGANGDSDPFTTSTRVWLPPGVTVAPGQDYTFPINLTAPSDAGVYVTDWRMVHENVAWFGATALRSISVSCNDVNAAQVVGHTLPTSMSCGDTTTATITLQNTGTTTWTRDLPAGGYKLAAHQGTDPFSASTRIWLPPGVTVAPGQSHTFSISMTAPSQEGSYVTDWQMVEETVEFFGPVVSRNVNVTCSEVDASQLISFNLPASMGCGTTYEASVRMKNVGTSTWTRDLPGGGFKLGSVDNDTTFHGGRVWLPAGVNVAPGQSYTFNFTMTAPSEPDVYPTHWRMVRENVAWFGPTASRNVIVSCASNNAAQVVSQNLPSTLECGDTYNASVTLRNIGDTTWTRDQSGGGYKLAAVGDSDPFTVDTRHWLPVGVEVQPQQTHTFSWVMTAPQQQGNHLTDWRMVEEFVEFFGPTISRTVNVTCGGPSSDDAQVLSFTAPASVDCDQAFSAQVTLHNNGTTSWTSDYELKPSATSAFGNGGPVSVTGTVAPGQNRTFTVSLTAPSGGGSYPTTWRMANASDAYFGETAQTTIAVSCGGAGDPEITYIAPDHVPADTVSNVTLTGQNLQNAQISVSQEPMDPGDPVPTAFPVVSVNSINGAGTSMSVRVDTRPAGVHGFYSLVVTTPSGTTGTALRVVDDGPEADIWTPSEPVRGDLYSLLITGVNLSNASVQTSQGIQVFGVSSTANQVRGFLQALNNAPLGPGSLTITTPLGSTTIPLTVVAGGNLRMQQENLSAEAAKEAAKIGEKVPEVYFQQFAVADHMPVARHDGDGGLDNHTGHGRFGGTGGELDGESDEGFFCYITLGWQIYSYYYTLALPFDPITGEVDSSILDGIGVGVPIPAGIKVFSFFADLYLEAKLRCFPVTHVQVCLYGNIGFEITGLGGQILSATGCFFSQFGFFLNVQTTGILGDFSFSTGTGCASVSQTTPPGAGGNQTGEVTLDECCSDELRVTTNGTAFAGTFYQWTFGATEEPVLDIEPDPQDPACQVPTEPDDYEIEVRAFIPFDHVGGGPLDVCNIGSDPIPSFLYFEGDERGYQPNPIGVPPQDGYRMEQKVKVYADDINCSGCYHTGEAIGSRRNSSGLTSRYAANALPTIDPADRDGIALDCDLWDQDGVASTVGWLIEVNPQGPQDVEVTFVAAGRNELAVVAPTIDWDFRVLIDESTSPASYTVEGHHDCFPAYEVYINNVQIWGHTPTTNNPAVIGSCLVPPLNMNKTCNGTVGSSATCL